MQLPGLNVEFFQISECNGSVPIVYRKKCNNSEKVRDKDNQGWIRNGEPIQVFRSVVNGEWVSKKQFEEERQSAKKVGAVYKSRKGFRVANKTYQGVAWYQVSKRRIAVFWNGESWMRLKRLVY